MTARNRQYGAHATRYGMDGPGFETWWGSEFPHPSRPALGPSSLLYSEHRVSYPKVKRPGPPRSKKELSYISTPPGPPTPPSAEVEERVELYISTLHLDHPYHSAPKLKKELSYISLLLLWTTHPIKRRSWRKSWAKSLLPLWTTHPIKRRSWRKSWAISLLPLWTVGLDTKTYTSRSPYTTTYNSVMLWCPHYTD
jgi:hypothetical protein